MAHSSPSSNGDHPASVAFDSDTFDDALHTLMEQRQRRTGTGLVFHGGTREQRQQALTHLTQQVTGTVHQFDASSLLTDRRMQTQNELRKAFDHAAEEEALLYFDRADPLFTHRHPDAPDADTAPTTLEYVFDRVGAFDGIVVLGLQQKRHVERAHRIAHLVVQFE
jgi:hypothetical protein